MFNFFFLMNTQSVTRSHFIIFRILFLGSLFGHICDWDNLTRSVRLEQQLAARRREGSYPHSKYWGKESIHLEQQESQQDLTRRPCGSQSHGEGGSSGKVQTPSFQHTCPHKHTNAPEAWEIGRVSSKLSWEICGLEHNSTDFLCVIRTSCIMNMDLWSLDFVWIMLVSSRDLEG